MLGGQSGGNVYLLQSDNSRSIIRHAMDGCSDILKTDASSGDPSNGIRTAASANRIGRPRSILATIVGSVVTPSVFRLGVCATAFVWLAITASTMLPSQRTKAAPTLEFLLTRDEPQGSLPEVAVAAQLVATLAVANLSAIPINDLQLGMAAAVEAVRQQREL